MKNFDWSKIKNSYEGFEELACRFVEDKFHSSSGWTHTQTTHDKNHDAYTLIMGFQPYAVASEQWWMEAKYSTKTKHLSRYRLDATIVSAILEQNVKKVIFVTNILINAKVMSDIRIALQRAVQCEEVYFYSKYTLEYWLSMNEDIRKEFFAEPGDDVHIDLAPYFVIDELEFYGEPELHLSFKEPLRQLYIGSQYYGYFSVFSDKPRTLKFRPEQNFYGIENIFPSKFRLKEGENPLSIKFVITEDYNHKKLGTQVPPAFRLGKESVQSKYHIVPKFGHQIITVKEQDDLLCTLNHAIKAFLNGEETTSVWICTGNSGIGKSFLLDRLMASLNAISAYYVEFGNNILSNTQQIIHSVLHILFPYIAPIDIDLDYIEKLGVKISPLLSEFIRNKNDFEKIENMLETIDETPFLYSKMSINQRLLIFDDVSKLTSNCKKLLCKMIQEISDKKLPVFILLVGQPQLWDTNFIVLKQEIYMHQLKYSLSTQTILECICDICELDIAPKRLVAQTIFPNLIQLFAFTVYLNTSRPIIASVEDLILSCILFRKSGIWERTLSDIFTNLRHQDPDGFVLCMNIYWSYGGISPDEIPLKYKDSLDQLLTQNIVKINKEGILVPFHDTYTGIFRKQNPIDHKKLFVQEHDRIELLQAVISKADDHQLLLDAVKKVEKLCDDQKFYSLNYILQETFEVNIKDRIRNQLGDAIYYRLYRVYALTVTNLSRDQSGRALFHEIYDETFSSGDADVMLVCTSVAWELINSYYEWLDFEKCNIFIMELKQLIRRMQNLGLLDPDVRKFIRYQNILVIQTLIDAEANPTCATLDLLFNTRYQNMVAMNFLNRADTFKVRYAHTILRRSFNYAEQLLKESMDEIRIHSGKEHKFYLWASSTCHFIDLLLERKGASLPLLLNDLEKMQHNYLNDYRKRTITLASWYFSIGDRISGQQYLFHDIAIQREQRPRLRGFYCEAMALWHLLNNETDAALYHLKEAEDIFSELPDYIDIIAHNRSLILAGCFSEQKIRFCLSTALEDGIYYLDLRSLY